MKARFCIENNTDRPVAAHLEQIPVRYWGLIPPSKKLIWDPENVQLDRGIYTLRAFDATSLNYEAPNMKKEKRKAVIGGILLGAGGVGALVSIPLFAVPGGALTIAGGVVIGAAAIAGTAAAAAGGATNILPLEYKTGVKRGAVIGKDTKYIVKLVDTNDKKELVWEKVTTEGDVYNRLHTIYATTEGKYTYPDKFPELIGELSVRSTRQQQPSSVQLPRQSTRQQHQPSIATNAVLRMPHHCDNQPRVLPDCEYHEMCRRYLDNLEGITSISGIFDSEYDKCFCQDCARRRNEPTVSQMGNPKRKFAIPWGYAKFGIKISPTAKERDIFHNWHVCYHGTKPEDLCSIIECERLIKPGDRAPDGSLREPGAGRWNRETAPNGHNVDQLFFSPTPAYSEMYASEDNFLDRTSSRQYRAKLLLQIRIKPGSYEVGRSTVASHKRKGPGPIDPNFSDDELEWMTNCECVHYIYGILIKLETY